MNSATPLDHPFGSPLPTAQSPSWLQDFLSEQAFLVDALDEGWIEKRALSGVFEGSPYLRRLTESDPTRLFNSIVQDPKAAVDHAIDVLQTTGYEDEAGVSRALRRFKAQIALTIALADLLGHWPTVKVTQVLTECADSALNYAFSAALHLCAPSAMPPLSHNGLCVIGMGKYGAFELNYSSDIDLIAVYDPDRFTPPAGKEAGPVAARIVQKMAHLLQAVTADGYVFRVDLRLRPNPSGTPVAVSLPAALSYYEALGQNWERAAMIKARTVAGDPETGLAFLEALKPFIWRRSLDYAAIADIHAMKRQIHAVKGHGEIATAGHNIKLGRGGIREIEFFAQTQQLIAGGRASELRQRGTIAALKALSAGGWITDATCQQLTQAYWTLRALEHRLQMVADQQTHTMPSDEEELEGFARFSGFENWQDCAACLAEALSIVRQHYETLFEGEAHLGSETGVLVFTGVDPDPETLTTLNSLGFGNSEQVWTTIAKWHQGKVPAMRTSRARERLTALTPHLLDALSRSGDPSGAFVRFSRFVEQLPAGIQFFSLLQSNPTLLDLLIVILGVSPRLSEALVRRPALFDAVLDPRFFGGLPSSNDLTDAFARTMVEAVSYEDSLDAARVFGQDQAFLIGVRQLSNVASPRDAAKAYTALADIVLNGLLSLVQSDFELKHGMIDGGELCVLAMGKLGSQEMTASSDLDLILIYRHPPDVKLSNGERPLAPSQYYARLTQRLIAAISAPTARGRLYDVDMRLRPSGNAGPVALSADAFLNYQRDKAWVWELMALTRARPLCGDPALLDRLVLEIADILKSPFDPKKIFSEADDMRRRIAREKPASNMWDLKLAIGGLLDIEFVAQTLSLTSLDQPTRAEPIGDRLDGLLHSGGLDPSIHAVLSDGYAFQEALSQRLRLCVDTAFEPESATEGLKSLLADAVALPNFETVEAALNDTQTAVAQAVETVFSRYLDGDGKTGAGPTD